MEDLTSYYSLPAAEPFVLYKERSLQAGSWDVQQ
jgi:hypothetical protein